MVEWDGKPILGHEHFGEQRGHAVPAQFLGHAGCVVGELVVWWKRLQCGVLLCGEVANGVTGLPGPAEGVAGLNSRSGPYDSSAVHAS